MSNVGVGGGGGVVVDSLPLVVVVVVTLSSVVFLNSLEVSFSVSAVVSVEAFVVVVGGVALMVMLL